MVKAYLRSIEYKKLIGPGIVAALFILLYYPTLEWMGNAWLHADNYSHGFILLPVIALIIWTRRRDLEEKQPYPNGIWLFVAGLALYIVGFLQLDNFISACSLFLTLPGLILFFRGFKALRTLAFPIFLLVFMIPLPWMDRIGFWLQSFAARSSAWIVDSVMGVDVVRTGSEIKLVNAEDVAFKVDLACSGMHSLIALLALAAIFAYILKGSFVRKAILFLFAIPVAILANLVRLVTIILIGNQWGEGAATGFYHDAASPFLFLVAIIVMVLIAKLLRFNLREIPD